MIQHQHRHTIYDVLEAKGLFHQNPANFYAVDSEGLPAYQLQIYPKMLYHPQAETRQVTQEEEDITKGGRVQVRGGLREMIHQVVNNEAEEKVLLEKGWHLSQAKAMRANGVSNAPAETVGELMAASGAEAELARARAMAAEAELEVLRAKLAEQALAQASATETFQAEMRKFREELELVKEAAL